MSEWAYGPDSQGGSKKTKEDWLDILLHFPQHLPLTTILLSNTYPEAEWNDIKEKAQNLQLSLTISYGTISMSPSKRED